MKIKRVLPKNKESELTIDDTKTTKDYHENAQTTDKRIVNNVIGMAWVGIIIIIVGIILTATIGLNVGISISASGAVIDLISSTILVLAKYEINSKDKYFETLAEMEEQEMIMDFINSIKVTETQSRCQETYINKYMDKFNNPSNT